MWYFKTIGAMKGVAMTINSTSKMLAGMAGKAKSEVTETADIERHEIFPVPQITPSSKMEHVLSNILGPSSSKKISPLD